MRRIDSDPARSARARDLAAALALVVVAVALLVLVGWAADVVLLHTVVPGLIAMNPMTAVGLALAGAAVALERVDRPGARRASMALGGVVALLGAAKLAHLAGAGPAVDRLLFAAELDAVTPGPAHMPLNTALDLVLVGLAILLRDVDLRNGHRPSEALAIVSGAVAFVVLVGYVLHTSDAGPSSFLPMALHSAVSFEFLAVAVLLARPDRGLVGLATRATPGGRLVRRLFLPAVLLPVAIGAVRWLGEFAGLYTELVGIAIMVVVLSLVSGAGIGAYALKMDAVEEEQRLATERLRELDRLREMDRFRERVVKVTSHELNTPLTAIRLQTHILKGRPADPGRSLEILDRNVERLGKLVQDLLAVVQLRSGRLILRADAVALDVLAADVVAGQRGAAERAGLALAVDAEPGLEVRGDADRLAGVLQALVDNAIKFTPRGGRVDVAARRVRDSAEVRVTDTGIGFDAAQKRRLFAAFEQVHDIERTTAAGAGLGLVLALGIVEAHGGTLVADSAGPGRGAVFVVRLPCAQ